MDSEAMLNKLVEFTFHKFDGVADSGGTPYFNHCLVVMDTTYGNEDPERAAIAVGHDLIEDRDITRADLVALGMSERVITGIEALTKDPEHHCEERYLDGIMDHEDAPYVKLADGEHNMDLSRLKKVRPYHLKRNALYAERRLKLANMIFNRLIDY